MSIGFLDRPRIQSRGESIDVEGSARIYDSLFEAAKANDHVQLIIIYYHTLLAKEVFCMVDQVLKASFLGLARAGSSTTRAATSRRAREPRGV